MIEQAAIKPRVLVVDDDPSIRTFLRHALKRSYDVLEASDGYDALSYLMREGERVDLIITDLRMPNLDGEGLIENLQEEIPLIIVSGHLDSVESQQTLERFQPVAVLTKPFDLKTLLAAVEKALGVS